MLLLVNKLINRPVLSLRTGGQVAVTYGCIISPDNLKIEGLYCHDRASKQNLILLYQDIRNIIDQGIIVNDHDVLSTPARVHAADRGLHSQRRLFARISGPAHHRHAQPLPGRLRRRHDHRVAAQELHPQIQRNPLHP